MEQSTIPNFRVKDIELSAELPDSIELKNMSYSITEDVQLDNDCIVEVTYVKTPKVKSITLEGVIERKKNSPNNTFGK